MNILENRQLLNCTGTPVPCEKAFKGRKNVLLYFATSDSPPCKQFLVNLKEMYTLSKKMRLKLEIIYVPFDVDEDTMITNFTKRHGGWYAVPFGDPNITILRVAFGITKVPSLIVLGENDTVVSYDGIKDFEIYGMNVLVYWTKKIPT